jgi:DNA-binding IclR family transcriptional regulator
MKDQSSVGRALGILQYIARYPGEHGVRSLSAALDLSPSTAHRLLDTLTRAGFVRQNPATERYSIGAQAVQLGIAALGSFDVTAVAPPCLRTLVAETGESAFLVVLDDGEVVYLYKEEGHRAIRTTARLGSRRPVHCTALGKSFLATMPPAEARALLDRQGMPALTAHTITDMARMWEELADIRLRGYAVDREEVELGLMCLAAPVRDYRGATVAAVSMAGPIERMQPFEERYGRRIAAAALEISLALGYIPRPIPEPAPA